MELKPGYKQTEVGVIPEDWTDPNLCDLGTVIRGASPRPKGDKRFYGGEIPRLMVEDVTRDGKYVTPKIDFLTEEGAKRSRPCKAGTLTIVCSGTVGVPSILAVDACIHDGFLALTNLNQLHCVEYLYYQFDLLRTRFDSSATHGGVFTNLTTTGVKEFKVALPFLEDERSQIATALSDVDALLDGLDRLIAKKRDIKQATMQQLLTGKTRLPGFEDEWEVKRFGELTSPSHSRIDPSRCEPHEFCVELEHIDQGSGRLLGWSATTTRSSLKATFESGDVLFGKLRAYLRKYWLANREGVCSTEIWVLRPNGSVVTSGYLYQIVQMDWFIEAASTAYGTHMPRSDWKVVKELELHIPPVPEQGAIATVISDMDAEIAALEQRRKKTQDIKQAMMQELLTGRTRLI